MGMNHKTHQHLTNHIQREGIMKEISAKEYPGMEPETIRGIQCWIHTDGQVNLGEQDWAAAWIYTTPEGVEQLIALYKKEGQDEVKYSPESGGGDFDWINLDAEETQGLLPVFAAGGGAEATTVEYNTTMSTASWFVGDFGELIKDDEFIKAAVSAYSSHGSFIWGRVALLALTSMESSFTPCSGVTGIVIRT
jgi:hypothetical protein